MLLDSYLTETQDGRLTKRKPTVPTPEQRLPAWHGFAVWLLAAAVLCVVIVSAAVSKMPGHIHCYKDVCHRVKTIAETDALIGKRLEIRTSHYDSPERDAYNVGKYTSSGEEFDAENASRAASAHFPDGTELLVWNPRNGRASHMRVNDFGPFHTDRTLDVTRSAAEKLGFAEYGVVWLHVYVIAGPDSDWPRYELARSYPRTEGFLGVIPRDQLDEVVFDLAERVQRKRRALKPIPPDQPAAVPPPNLAITTAAVPLKRQAKLHIKDAPAARPILDDARVDDRVLLRQPLGTRARVYKISVDAKPSWVRTRISPLVLSAVIAAGLDPAYARYQKPVVLAQANVLPHAIAGTSEKVEFAQSVVWKGTTAFPVSAAATTRFAQVPTNTSFVRLLDYDRLLPARDHLVDRGADTQVAVIDQMARRRVVLVRGRDLTVEFPALLGPSTFQLAIPALMILLTFLTWLMVGRREEMVGVAVNAPPPLAAPRRRLRDVWPVRPVTAKYQRDSVDMIQPPPIPKQHKVVHSNGADAEPVTALSPQSDASSTVIGAGATLVGKITSASEVVISGNFEGPCTARQVEIAEGGSFKGQVDTVALVVGGNLNADIQTGHVHVTRTGKVDGDVNYDELSVEKGGILSARCQLTGEKDR